MKRVPLPVIIVSDSEKYVKGLEFGLYKQFIFTNCKFCELSCPSVC